MSQSADRPRRSRRHVKRCDRTVPWRRWHLRPTHEAERRRVGPTVFAGGAGPVAADQLGHRRRGQLPRPTRSRQRSPQRPARPGVRHGRVGGEGGRRRGSPGSRRSRGLRALRPVLGLDALGDGAGGRGRASKEADDAGDEGARRRVGGHRGHEAPVDLEVVGRQVEQVGHAGEAGAEVVDGEVDAVLVEGGDRSAHGGVEVDDDVLGDLEHEPRGVDAGRREVRGDVRCEVVAVQVVRADVDVDGHLREARDVEAEQELERAAQEDVERRCVVAAEADQRQEAVGAEHDAVGWRQRIRASQPTTSGCAASTIGWNRGARRRRRGRRRRPRRRRRSAGGVGGRVATREAAAVRARDGRRRSRRRRAFRTPSRRPRARRGRGAGGSAARGR